MKKGFAVILLIIAAGNIHAFGSKQASSAAGQAFPAEPAEPTRAEQVVKALMRGYPDIITRAEFRNGDWAILMRDNWYYYAEGRLLTTELRATMENYRTVQFYRYPAELPPWMPRPPEERERLLSLRTRNQNIITRRSNFFEDLWLSHDREEAYNNIRTIGFLGKQVRIHHSIQGVLAQVEERIRLEARTDPQVQAWINSINTTEAWGWRNIAETQSRSFHSYGVAIDLLPRSLSGKQTYWLWSADWREDWWNIPYNERYHPPASVIRAFENHGFVWGGKWFMFDTMHFEYRPEVIILNGLHLEARR